MAVTEMTMGVTTVSLTTEDLQALRFTPRELRLISEQFGRSLSAILDDEQSDDKFVMFAWLKLRRDGHDLDRDAMDDVLISFEVGKPDPTNGQQQTILPSSAAIGA